MDFHSFGHGLRGRNFFPCSLFTTADPCDIKDFRDVVVYPWCRMHSSNRTHLLYHSSACAERQWKIRSGTGRQSEKSTASRTDLRNDRAGARSFDRFFDQRSVEYAERTCARNDFVNFGLHIFWLHRHVYRAKKVERHCGGTPADDRL